MCIFLVLSLTVVFAGINRRSGVIWDNYYIIAVPEDEGAQSFSILEEMSGDEAGIVSAYNTEFSFNDFGRMELVGLKELQNRFVDGDPRLDPFMQSAGQYFTAEGQDQRSYELIYVKSSLSALGFYIKTRIHTAHTSDNWIFPDFNLRNHLIANALFLLGWFYCIWISKGLRLPAFIAGIPWFAAVMSSGSLFMPSAVVIYLLFILLFRETFTDMLFYLNYGKIIPGRNIVFYASALIAGSIISTVLNFRSGLPVIQIWLSLAADFLFIFIYYSLKSHKVQMQEHRLFFPVFLSENTAVEDNVRRLQEISASAAAVILIPLFLLFMDTSLPLEVPVPDPAGSLSSWSWEGLEFADRSSQGMADASDLLTHIAYQQGFMYGRDYEFPYRDEKIINGRFVFENNEILYREDCIRQFTEQWYTSIINTEFRAGLPALLFSQNAPGGISIKSDISNFERGFNPVRHILAGLLAFLPITGQFLVKVRITVRRKGQEA